MNQSEKNNIILIIFFIIFCVYTLISNNAHVFGLFRDESHAWTISQNCSLTELFGLMKVEGHMLIWYLILMPFAKLKLWYPNIMLYINWIFCMLALVIVINNKKFHVLTKVLLMFSPVFLCLYAVFARCYSIGIFFLFLACAYYKERLKHPYIYFLILFLAANTSILAAIAASGLGIIFLYDLYKEKTENKQKPVEPLVIIILTLLTGIMYYFQFFPVSLPGYEINARNNMGYTNIIRLIFGLDKMYGSANWIIVGLSRVFGILCVYLFSKNNKILFLFLYIMLVSSAFFAYIYTPYEWHLGFYLVYLFICYWIFIEENNSEKNKLYATILITVIISLTYILPANNRDSKIGSLFNIINNSKELRQAKLFSDLKPIDLCSYLPYLNNEGIYIYDINNVDYSSYKGLQQYYESKKINYGELPNFLDKTKDNYIISGNNLTKDKNYKYVHLKLYMHRGRYYVYKIILNK